jgi:AcrR family transcriptional regulator
MTTKKERPYHHGDLAAALRQAARAILEEEGLGALSLRSVARRAGVSHAAPYRHYASREALLAALAVEGYGELREAIAKAAAAPGGRPDRIAHIGAAYMRFAVHHGGLMRLMFGSEFLDRTQFAGLTEASDLIGHEVGVAVSDPILGLAVWAAIHGLAALVLENVIDLGQRKSGTDALPSRAEILLRSLLSEPLQ